MIATFRRMLCDEGGANIVEFALLSVPLLGMILGFGDLAYQTYVKANLQASLNDIARTAVVEDPRIGGTGTIEDRIQAAIKDRMKSLVSNGTYTFDIQNFKNFSAIDRPESLITDKNKNGQYDAGDCWEDSNPNGRFDTSAGRAGLGGAEDVVVYNVGLSAPHLFPVLGFVTSNPKYSVSASALVRTQPYANQRQPDVVC
ncbi:hypothetical protein GCM10022281_24210 [Sphingomonas rosea]|uniref:Pilus assembly protein n=1 Tax=Sphingomonas rosea TaxID=335605 RepID=A0ABP7UFE1_9SPHN